MATLEIEGKRVQVGEDFLKLSPEQQHATVTEIARTMGITPKQALPAAMQHPKDVGMAERFAFGFREPFMGAEQVARHGGLGTAEGRAEFDEYVRQQESEFAQRTESGFDIARAAGSAVNPLNLATAGSIPAGLVGGALGGAIGGLTQPTAGDYEAEKLGQVIGGGAVGAGLGGLGQAAQGIKRVVTPYPISRQRQEQVNILREHGVEPTAGEVSGSELIRDWESTLGNLPGAGGAFQRIKEGQAEDFTRAALVKAGIQNESLATTSVVNRGFQDNSARFNRIAGQTNLQSDRQMLMDIHAAFSEYMEQTITPRPFVERSLRKINDAMAANGGRLDGRLYQDFRQQIAKYERETDDKEYAAVLGGIRRALDDAMERTIARTNPKLLGEWRDVRNQFRNLLVISKANSMAGEKSAMGVLTPAAIRSAVKGMNPRDYATGKGDYGTLARAGEAILTPRPSSGTSQREAAQRPVKSFLEGTLVGAPLMSDPVQTYLKNQLITGSAAPLRRGLTALAPGAGGAMAQPAGDELSSGAGP